MFETELFLGLILLARLGGRGAGGQGGVGVPPLDPPMLPGA